MKQVLLRVAAVRSEMTFREFPQLRLCDFSLSWKIFPSQHPLDPDVDGECAQPLVGKKHYATGDLRPDTGQTTEFLPKLGVGKRRPRFQIRISRVHQLRSGAKVGNPVAKRASTQIILRDLCNSRWSRESVNCALGNFARLAESTPQCQGNLADVRHLFH